MSDVKCAGLEHLHHLGVKLSWRTLQAPAIDAQEHVGSGVGDALVTVRERVGDREAFHQRGSLGHDVIVVTGLRAEQRSFQRPRIAYPGGTAVTCISTMCMLRTSATVR